MLIIDENLGYGAASVSALGHLVSRCVIAIYFVFAIVDAFPPEEHFGADAVGASLPSVDFYIGFDAFRVAS